MAARLELPASTQPQPKSMFSDRGASEGFAALAKTAARALGAPWASIAVFEGGRVVFRIAYGAEPDGSIDWSALAADVPEESARDAGTAGEWAAFAAVAIVTSDGRRSGALCVPQGERGLPRGSVDTLASIAGLAARQIETQRALYEANAVRRELSTVIGASPIAICTLDTTGLVWSWSPAAERLSGYGSGDVVGRFPPWVPGGRSNRDFRELLSAIRRGASYLNQRSRRVRADGTPVDIRISAAPMFADDGSVAGFVSMEENVDELERAERRLYLFESAVAKTNDAVFVTAAQPVEDPEILWVNDAFLNLFGYDADEVVGKRVSDLRSLDFDRELASEIERSRREAVHFRGTVLYRRKDGGTFWCESSLSPVVEADGRCENWIVIARDVTAQRRSERLQKDRGVILEMIAADEPMERIFATLVETAERARPGAGAFVRLRRDATLYRVASGSEIGEPAAAFGSAVDVGDRTDPCGRAVVEATQVVTVRGGFARWSSPIRSGATAIAGTFAMHASSDATPSTEELRLGDELAHLAGLAMERHEDREQLEFLALHDALTGLPNRKLFQTRLDAAISAAQRRGRQVALGLIDLDRFKIVNDSLGHAVGDQLLRDVANRLARSVRPGDTIARLGGDEFVLLIDDLGSREEAMEIAERVLLALVPSFVCAGQEVFVRASMGLSTYPVDAPDASGLLALGDAAMYQVKAQGREVAFHERGDDRQGIARIALETALNHALENREFEVLFQPQVELRSREIRGAEALLRWNHPTQGLMLPDTFVRAAEDTGLIVPIGAWVLEEACRFARQWQDEGFDRFVSVNVSARQFDRPEFVEMVTRTLANVGLNAERLHLELTESLVMRSPEKAAQTLGELKALGVKIVIDDFGTGYSSFNYLKRFPLDALKIDRLFVRDIGFGSRAPNDEAIVRAIVGVARALDLKIVAEGVENEDQVAFLRAIGVPLAQGFLFAPGLRAERALRWTRTASRR